MKHIFGMVAITAILALGLFGCSGSSPSNSQVEKDVALSLDNTTAGGKVSSNPTYEVVSVTRTNGKKDGESGYQVEAEYALKFRRGIDETVAELKANAGENNFMVPLLIQAIRANWGDFKKGETKKFTKWFAYSKTEKGWKFDGEKKEKTAAE
jgi:hypothetical protein